MPRSIASRPRPPEAIIVGLFLLQRLGTGAVGRLFGPVMGIWFAAIGAIGVHGVAAHPEILKALLATYALDFLAGHFSTAFFSLAAVVLAVTGAGALGAGHRRFLNCGKATTPLAMRANVEHDQVLHEHVLILSIETMPVPHVPAAEGLEIDGFVYKDDRIVHITALRLHGRTKRASTIHSFCGPWRKPFKKTSPSGFGHVSRHRLIERRGDPGCPW